MTELIIAIISAITSFGGAFLAASLGMKNKKQEEYFAEKKRVYYELATILPDVERFIAQSDYMDGSEGACGAEGKISVMKVQLEDAVKRKQKLAKQSGVTSETKYDIETEINNLKYKIGKHEEYLAQMKQLRDKIDEFELNGNKNLLRIFASINVWNSYVRFCVALDNEYICDIGVKKEDIIYHINALIAYMRMDLSGKEK